MSAGSRGLLLPRLGVTAVAAAAVLLPLGIILWQSLLDAPFFSRVRHLGLTAYRFVLADPDFAQASWNSLVISSAMALIAVPGGAALAFLLARTDLPGRRLFEVGALVPVFLSPMVMAFGYVVAAGPVGFVTLWARPLLGPEPWNLYAVASIAVIAGLSHVPYVTLYASAALRALGSDLEEAARVAGAGPLRVALTVSLPMIAPALLYAGVLVFFLGFELFGLPLVLGDPEGHLVLATYLYKLTNKLGVPSYHLMAAVAVFIVAITFPLVLLQRFLLRTADRYVAVKGKAARPRLLALGWLRWPLALAVGAWLAVTVLVPLAGIGLRAVVTSWGEGVRLSEVLTLEHFGAILDQPNLVRAVIHSVEIGIVGGALAVACYTAVGLVGHRRSDGISRFIDHLVLLPRAVPGLLAGLAFLWVFLFVPGLQGLRGSIASVWLAYTVVWLAYGMRLVSSSLLQVAPELEEGARVAGAGPARVLSDVTLPLARHGLLASWLLVFLIFEREYATGVYLLGPGTEVIGSMLVSLWAGGSIDLVAALSLVNTVLVAAGLFLALRLGVRLHE